MTVCCVDVQALIPTVSKPFIHIFQESKIKIFYFFNNTRINYIILCIIQCKPKIGHLNKVSLQYCVCAVVHLYCINAD